MRIGCADMRFVRRSSAPVPRNVACPTTSPFVFLYSRFSGDVLKPTLTLVPESFDRARRLQLA